MSQNFCQDGFDEGINFVFLLRWKIDGIETVNNGEDGSGNLVVVCKTSHLTNFAVLMSVTPIEVGLS